MKRDIFLEYMTLGAIIPSLPNNILDGQAVDAVPVMANFNAILSAVNANAASATALSSLTTTVNANGLRASFTPTVAFGGASVGLTYNIQVGYQFPVQNVVFVCGAVSIASKGTSVGAMTIGGLPTAANIAWMASPGNPAGFPISVVLGNMTIPGSATGSYPCGIITPNTGTMAILGMANNSYPAVYSQLDVNPGGQSTSVQFFGLYPIS